MQTNFIIASHTFLEQDFSEALQGRAFLARAFYPCNALMILL